MEWTQRDAANYYDVPVSCYRNWEDDKREHDQPDALLGTLKPNEWCFVLRRRHDYTLDAVGLMMNMPRDYVHRAEKGVGDCTALVEWWLAHLE